MLKAFLAKFYHRLPIVHELLDVREELKTLHADLKNLAAIQTANLIDFELPKHPRYNDPKRLLSAYLQVCSQNGEDGMIHEIFRRIGTTTRTFAEVGVGDGSENNTAFLLSQGWTGFWIDGCADFARTLEARPDLPKSALQFRVSYVSRENIAGLFVELGVPKELDLLSLDIDQNTYQLWEGLREYRPRVIVIEYNSSIPPDVDWKVEYRSDRTWDRTHNFGASLKAFENLGRELGYSLVSCEFLGANAFFVRNDLVGDKFAAPFTAENHYEPPRYGMLHRRGHASAILDRVAKA